MTGVVILVVAIVIAAIVMQAKAKAKLKKAYDEALRGTNKKVALDAGRKYYASLRKDGRLTIYDEQAITNDVNAMEL
jgi:hypothetical protein